MKNVHKLKYFKLLYLLSTFKYIVTPQDAYFSNKSRPISQIQSSAGKTKYRVGI